MEVKAVKDSVLHVSGILLCEIYEKTASAWAIFLYLTNYLRFPPRFAPMDNIHQILHLYTS